MFPFDDVIMYKHVFFLESRMDRFVDRIGIICLSRENGMRIWMATFPWWRHQMDTFSALLALCEGIPPVTGGFPSQRPVTQSFDVFFDLRQNKRLSKQSRRRWLETPPRSLWHHCNDICNVFSWWLRLNLHVVQWIQFISIVSLLVPQANRFNSLWPSDAIWRHRYGSILFLVTCVARWHKDITWSNVDLSLVRSCGFLLRARSQEMFNISNAWYE